MARSIVHTATTLGVFTLVLCLATPANADERDGALGTFVLDVMEASDGEQESRAMRILRRAAEIFTEITVPEQDDRHVQDGHRGNGPPDWAPAHGWRRNFGEQETNDLGGFTRRKIEEGLSGKELILAVRGEIERVVDLAKRAGDDEDEPGNRGAAPSEKPEKASSGNNGNPGKGNQGGKAR